MLGAAALIAAPVILLALFAYQTVASDAAQRAAAERIASADLAARLIERRLGGTGEQVQLLALRPTLRTALQSRDSATLQLQLPPYMADLKRVGGTFTSAAVFDARGMLLASDPATPGLASRDDPAADHFTGAMSSSQPFVSSAFADPAPPHSTLVAVSFAVRTGSEAAGVIAFTLSAEQLLADIGPARGVPGRGFVVVDTNAHVVATSDASFAPIPTGDPSGLEGALKSATDGTTIRAGGDDRIVSVRPVSGTGWTLYVLDRASMVFAPERQLAGQLATAGIIASAAAVLIALFIGRLNETVRSQRDQLVVREADLVDVNARLEAATGAKSAFLANMSHELRTPLNAILGFSSLLQGQLGPTLTERQRRFLHNIEDAGDHLLEIINDVLDLSKVEAGKLELRREVVTLAALLEPVIAAGSAAAQAKGVVLQVEASDASGLVLDATRARQVLFNLLSNAVKFTPAGGRVRLEARLEGRDLLFDVADTGIGIPPEKKGRVFGVFERLHEGRVEATGTGLGLAITKRLVELHGGAITFDSVEGQGTTFHVRLPEVRSESVAGERILVVEDERHDAELIVAIASSFDLRAEVVRTLAAAEEALRRGTPLGVVLDLRLPDGRGEELLRGLKRLSSPTKIPVLVATVEAEPSEALTLGADDYLTKPLDRARLESWLGRVARRAAMGDAKVGGTDGHPAH